MPSCENPQTVVELVQVLDAFDPLMRGWGFSLSLSLSLSLSRSRSLSLWLSPSPSLSADVLLVFAVLDAQGAASCSMRSTPC